MFLTAHWTVDPAFAWLLAAATLYWLGGRHNRRGHPSAADRWREASFVAGLATIAIALGSPVHDLADELLWVHMVQHILLVLVAPPLLALARPWNRMWHGLPLEFRRATARAVTRSPRLAPLRRTAAIYAGLALLVGWMLAMVLALATSPLYAPYAAQASRPGGISALADQHLAAGMMWVPGSIPFTVIILFLAYRWLDPTRAHDQERRPARVHATDGRHLTRS
jgi:cytochrome c oxidase assembly factor CtaG